MPIPNLAVSGMGLWQILDWRPFGDADPMRLHYRRPDVNLFGVGIALAALLASFPKGSADRPSERLVVFVVGAAAALLMCAGIFHKVPAPEVDERWDDRLDQLRDKADAFLKAADSEYGLLRASNKNWRPSWRDYVECIPIPDGGSPMTAWAARLAGHQSDDVQQFFAFARLIERPHGDFRRFAVRTYHRFGRLHRGDAPGFRQWMEDEGVADGAEPIVVILAYMEAARADAAAFGKARHRGFWHLAKEWHPNTMALPRPHTDHASDENKNT